MKRLHDDLQAWRLLPFGHESGNVDALFLAKFPVDIERERYEQELREDEVAGREPLVISFRRSDTEH